MTKRALRWPLNDATNNRSGGRPLSVCALVPYPVGTVPGQRYRIEQWAGPLASDGISISFIPFATPGLMRLLYQRGRFARKAASMLGAYVRHVLSPLRLRSYDIVVVHRTAGLIGPALVEHAVRRLGKPLVFDFDDAVHLLHTSEVNRRLGWLKFPSKTATICRLSHHVVVGNTYLADFARRHASRVTIVPSSIDTNLYRPAPRRRSARIVIGWMGSSTSQQHLELFAPVLTRLVAAFDVELRIVSDRRPSLDGIPLSWTPWTAPTEVEDLAGFDIGIMPMPDDEWSRGKCAMKALQYMGMGIPTVASAVGMNRDVIRDGNNGFLAESADDWLDRVGRLVRDEALRRRLGEAGRQTVEQSYSTQQCATRFGAVLRGVARGHDSR